jgi:predicted GNAT superfamily acetyltransferase
MSEIIVRPLATMAEIRAAEAVQRGTWSMTDLDIIPAHVLHAIQHNGAALLGAFDEDRLVGFSFAILATEDEPGRIDQVAAARLKMYSVVTGVLPAFQKHNVGFQLKMAQRDFALRIGIRLITWTYDPLESMNARFNIGKLGAVCRRYFRDFHGDMTGINAGLPTDRFEVEWWVTANRVRNKATRPWRPLKLDSLLAGGALLVNEAEHQAGSDWPVPPPNYISQPSNLMLVEIPANFQAMKRENFDLAYQWRMHTRDLFEKLFDSGFLVTDFVPHEDAQGHRRSFYLLTHQDS